MKIVLIDDSQTNLIVLKSLSNKIPGSECMGFTDSEAGLDYLANHDAGLVVVDYSMPRVTGIEVAKRLRVSLRHGDTPIVMVSSSTDPAVHARAFEVGVTEFLTKPIRAHEFLALLAEFAGNHRRDAAPAQPADGQQTAALG